ncbi:MAG: hypothetical protein CVT90_00995, partial [Candidatus Altiarchaeales archaeon HGW-Altiarchaeales-3]
MESKTNKTGYGVYRQKNIFYGLLIFGLILIFGLSGSVGADITSNIDIDKSYTLATIDLSDNKSIFVRKYEYIDNLTFTPLGDSLLVNVTGKSAYREFYLEGLSVNPYSTVEFDIIVSEVSQDLTGFNIDVGNVKLWLRYRTDNSGIIYTQFYDENWANKVQESHSFSNMSRIHLKIDFDTPNMKYNLSVTANGESHNFINQEFTNFKHASNPETMTGEPWTFRVTLSKNHEGYTFIIGNVTQTIPQNLVTKSMGKMMGLQFGGYAPNIVDYALPVINKYEGIATELYDFSVADFSPYRYLKDNHGWEIAWHGNYHLTDMPISDAYAEIDEKTNEIKNRTGEFKAWTCWGNALNSSHINYAWTNHGIVTRVTTNGMTYAPPMMHTMYQEEDGPSRLDSLFSRSRILNIYTHKVLGNLSKVGLKHDIWNETFDHYLGMAHDRDLKITSFETLWYSLKNQLDANITNINFTDSSYKFTVTTNGYPAYIVVNDYYNISQSKTVYVKDAFGKIQYFNNVNNFEFWASSGTYSLGDLINTCSDGTPYGQCSTTKPGYCDNGTLIDNCSLCGCDVGQECNVTSGQCYISPSTCSDGTPYGQCSTTKPGYCDNGTLIDNCSLCGCDAGQECNVTSGVCYPISIDCTCNNCTDCSDKLNHPACNTVNLITDINPNETCIIFPANNKIFDCGGHTIEGDSTGGDIGIHLTKKSGNKIKNCVITGFYRGVALYYSTSNLIINNTANSNSYGIYLYYSSDNILSDNTGNLNNYYGIYLYYSSNNTIVNNAAGNNQRHGLYISTSDGTGNTINSNTLCNNNQYGGSYYDIYDADNNTGDDNTCDTTHNWNDTGGVGCTFSCVANTCSDGTLYGSCSTTKPGYCDNGTLIDNCGLCGCGAGEDCNATSGMCYTSATTDCTCTNCTDCSDKLNNPACAVVKLTTDINHNETCIIFPANNKIFDCGGHTIEGDGIGGDVGIYLNGKENNTIKNCIITDFYDGIRLVYSPINTLTNNTANNNTRYGIYLGSSSNNALTNNTANDNGNGTYGDGDGILLSSSSNNTLTSNTANNNTKGGIRLYSSSSNNTITNNTANSNWDTGILLSGSSNNNIVSNNCGQFNGQHSIEMHTSDNNKIIENIANNNSVDGIFLYNTASNNQIINNTANNNTLYGIRVSLYSNNNEVAGNIANLNGYGIYLSSSSNNTLTSNTANDNNNYGIYLQYSSNDNTLNSNSICNNTNSDINIATGTGNAGDNTCDNLDNVGNNVTCSTSCSSTSTCSDGTLYGQCSTTKPKYCNNGTLIDNCSLCGCDAGQDCNTTSGQCHISPSTCSDGTPYGSCSSTKPGYCDNGTLIDNCGLCGC